MNVLLQGLHGLLVQASPGAPALKRVAVVTSDPGLLKVATAIVQSLLKSEAVLMKGQAVPKVEVALIAPKKLLVPANLKPRRPLSGNSVDRQRALPPD